MLMRVDKDEHMSVRGYKLHFTENNLLAQCRRYTSWDKGQIFGMGAITVVNSIYDDKHRLGVDLIAVHHIPIRTIGLE